MDAYLKQRAELIASERALRPGHARIQQASEAELKAEQIVRKIRADEAHSIWHSENPDFRALFREASKEQMAEPNDDSARTTADEWGVEHPEVVNLFPGMAFLTARKIIENTKLYKIVQKMPKGGILHSHLDSTVDVDFALSLAVKQPGMHISVPEPVTANNVESILPQFRQMASSFKADATDVSHAAYAAETWVPYAAARQSFSSSLGGPAGFDAWVRSTMKIDPNEAYTKYNSHRKMWDKLRNTFYVSNGLLRSIPIFTQYIKEYFWASIADGISYVEPRVNFLFKAMWSAEGEQNVTHREFVALFGRIIDEVKAELKEQGREGEFVGAKIIYTTIKIITPEEMEWYFDECIALKQEFPQLIAGFDLVGPEDFVKPLKYYAEGLLRFRKRIDDLGLDLPFILHAGETLGDGDEVDDNLYDAILLDTKRIGHGFSLVKHPLLMDTCKKRGIPLEICPISNELLRLTSSMPAHPMPMLIAHGIEVVVSNDDPGAFGNLGLSYDFFQVLVASEVTGLLGVGVIARRSLEASMLEADRKAKALASWDARWAEFVDWINKEYGHLLDK
ncbi:Metallo-dependent hydrolase [Exidia glandulosa HHB12029]|uniref:Metallo-dependent hydrolase n=1 Tax=Exidia glandulosa HHB12029 TaxID=1314781 RepID=A0A166AAV5_EXIGL|nr:Metallo-dependent hydrolase [Exidia glandulosa HHB12029]